MEFPIWAPPSKGIETRFALVPTNRYCGKGRKACGAGRVGDEKAGGIHGPDQRPHAAVRERALLELLRFVDAGGRLAERFHRPARQGVGDVVGRDGKPKARRPEAAEGDAVDGVHTHE